MAEVWEAVIGQPAAVTVLRAAAQRGEVPHAWLFVGPGGVGQDVAGRALAAALNCPSGGAGEPCGDCSTCRRILAGTHPAMRSFEPEGATHVVDSVREEWIPAATRTLLEGRRKVLRVGAADRMNEPAQNAFLKVLEEPPPSVVWILEAEDETALLDTVVSRCRRLDFVAWSPAALRERAGRLGIAAERLDVLVAAAMGSPQRLEDLADPDVAEARERHLSVIRQLVDEGPGIVVTLARDLDRWARSRTKARRARSQEEVARYEEAFGGEWPPGVRQRLEQRLAREERGERRRALGLVLDDLGSYLRDLVWLAGGGDATGLVNPDREAELRVDAGRVPLAVALDGLRAVAGCRDALERYGQPELHLERVLLRIAVGLYRAA